MKILGVDRQFQVMYVDRIDKPAKKAWQEGRFYMEVSDLCGLDGIPENYVRGQFFKYDASTIEVVVKKATKTEAGYLKGNVRIILDRLIKKLGNPDVITEGSEKQIAFANAIRKVIIADLIGEFTTARTLNSGSMKRCTQTTKILTGKTSWKIIDQHQKRYYYLTKD